MDERIAVALSAAGKHPARRLARRYSVVASLLAVSGVAAIVASYPLVLAAPLILAGAVLGRFSWRVSRAVRQVTLINRAYDRLSSGHLEEGRALLDAASRNRGYTHVERAASLQRALQALDAGDSKQAEAHASLAIVRRRGLMTRDFEQTQMHYAHAIRALARASLHDHDGALADADAADKPDVTVPTVAYAQLARAVVAASDDRKATVREALERAAPFLDNIDGRTRELARALARFARETKRSIYRHPAKPESTDSLDTWMARMAPAAALHAMSSTPIAPTTTLRQPALPSTNAASALLREAHTWNGQRRLGGGSGWATLGLWTCLVLMFLAIWQFLNSTPTSHPPQPPAARGGDISSVALGIVVFVSVFLIAIGRNVHAAADRSAQRRRLALALLRGDASARDGLERLAKMGDADAALDLATFAERRGDFAGAIATCERALGRATASLARRVMSYDAAAPGLAAERAFCLAAMGRPDDANAALAAMPNRDGYGRATTAHFRVSLAQALVHAGGAPRGDRAQTLEVARARGLALPIPSRDALLLDLLEATEGAGVDDEEWTRIQSELAASPDLATWIDHFLPNARRAKPLTAPA